jgi:hypothetical protein
MAEAEYNTSLEQDRSRQGRDQESDRKDAPVWSCERSDTQSEEIVDGSGVC